MKDEELKMFTLFSMTPDLVCVVDKAGFFKQVNPAVSKTLGYTEEELFDGPVARFIHPDDKEMTRLNRLQLLENNPLLNFQNRYLSKDGGFVWLEWTSIYIPDKEIVFAIAKNITKRKQKEIETEDNYKKYKSLATHFKNNIEKDRKYFAVELREDLAQVATVLKMNIDCINLNAMEWPAFQKEQLEKALRNTNLLINKIRKLSYSISPDMITDLGFNEVVQGLCNEFSFATGITCVYETDLDETILTHEIKLDFYRICQEALLNVMRHAEATQVKISIKNLVDKIQLSVADNGKGFIHTEEEHFFGLNSMRGRAISINGELTIETKINGGTKVRLEILQTPGKIRRQTAKQ